MLRVIGDGRGFRAAWTGLAMSIGLGLAVFAVSCGGEDHPPLIGSIGSSRTTPGEGCAYASEGCACVTEGAITACGEMLASQGEQVTCAEGRMTCLGGRWSTCSNDRRVTKLAPRAGGARYQDLATNPSSCEDPCNPSCVDFVDTPTGIDAPGFTVDNGALTLPEQSSTSACRDIVITPSSPTVTVTSLEPIVTDPPQIAFRATCGAGGPIFAPTWSLTAGDADVAHIEGDGVFEVHAGIAKTVQVTASSSVATATTTVDVLVDVTLVDPGCAQIVPAFANPTDGPDPGRTLYPYALPDRPVVFPLGLSAPLLQWSTGGVDTPCIKVALEYPSGAASPTFSWSQVLAGSGGVDPRGGDVDANVPAYAIPQLAWSSFDRTAQGTRGDIVLRRQRPGAGDKSYQALRVPVEFAGDALRGTVYYTQYVRRLHDGTRDVCGGAADGAQPDIDVTNPRFATSAASGCLGNNCAASSGPVCPVGVCTQVREPQTAMVQALELTPGARPVDPFRGTATGCPVCHSVSADGSKFVANVFAGGANIPTVSTIGRANGEASFDSYADAPAYSWAANRGESSGAPRYEQSWGLAYAALSPDGRFALQGPNFWGSTRHDMAIGQGNAQDANYGAGGKRYFLLELAKYRANVNFATTGPLPAHAATRTTITASAAGTLSIDGANPGAGASVLIKNEPVLAQNGFYRVLDPGSMGAPFRLERLADADDAGELAFGQKAVVTGGTSNSGRYFHVAGNPATAITPGSSDLTFALYTTVMASTSAPLPAYTVSTSTSGARRLTGTGRLPVTMLDDVPAVQRTTVLVKNETGAAAASNGVYSLTTEDPWTLTRRSDLDAGWEMTPAVRVRVNQGTRFGGSTFVLTTPDPITLDTTGLAFELDAALDEGNKFDAGGTATTLPSMMYPVFAPDGRSLAYVAGDSDVTGGAPATGWRRGLGLLNFDANNAATPFSAKRHVLNTFAAATPGTVFKWPFFEPDSESLVYVQAPATEFCPIEAYGGRCAGEGCTSSTTTVQIDTNIERACFQGSNAMGHGNGAPTHRGYWPGRLHAVNTTTSADAELAHVNQGLGAQTATLAADDGKAYQPTVLPFASGGYRWVIFTSTRAYGNQMNPVGTNFSCSASLLWMAAVDDEAAGSGDRSHPAFLLPGQNITSIVDPASSRHFINERGYLVPSPCKELHAECGISSECCGGSGVNPSTECLFDSDADPPHRTCEDVSTCAEQGDVCVTDDDCCAGALCHEGVCAAAPTHSGAIFTRLYTATCPVGYDVRWGNFEWHARAESSSRIDFYAQVATSEDFSSATSVLLASADQRNVNPVGTPPITVNVQDTLVRNDVASAPYLLVSMDFRPSNDGSVAPILYDWNQRYDCVAAE